MEETVQFTTDVGIVLRRLLTKAAAILLSRCFTTDETGTSHRLKEFALVARMKNIRGDLILECVLNNFIV